MSATLCTFPPNTFFHFILLRISMNFSDKKKEKKKKEILKVRTKLKFSCCGTPPLGISALRWSVEPHAWSMSFLFCVKESEMQILRLRRFNLFFLTCKCVS